MTHSCVGLRLAWGGVPLGAVRCSVAVDVLCGRVHVRGCVRHTWRWGKGLRV